MIYKKYPALSYLLLLALGANSYSLFGEETKKVMNLDLVQNQHLKRSLALLNKGKQALPSRVLYLLRVAIDEEEEVALGIISQLSPFLAKKGYLLEKHRLMRYALEKSPSRIIALLLKLGIYDERFLKGKVRYSLLTRISLYRIITQLKVDPIVSKLLQLMQTVALVTFSLQIFLLCGLLDPASYRDISRGIALIRTINFPLLLLKIAFQLASMASAGYKAGTYPSYLIRLLQGNRSKYEKEEIGLLLLAHGANPNSRCLIITDLATEEERLKALYSSSGFISLREKYVIHFAAERDMPRLLEELVAQGANPNAVALYVADSARKVNFASQDLIFLDRSYKRSKCIDRQTALDFAFPGSGAYYYLSSIGAKSYKELKEKKR